METSQKNKGSIARAPAPGTGITVTPYSIPPGAKHNQASFAFKLAREATNRIDATYKAGSGRKEMILESEFLAAFTAAKARIRAMSYRSMSR